MRLWEDGIIALLAAIGLASLLWTVARAVFFAPARRQAAIALVSVRGDAEPVEEQVRILTLLRCEQGVVGEILLVDCGLTEEGRKLCRLLAGKDRRISLCKIHEIEKYIT